MMNDGVRRSGRLAREVAVLLIGSDSEGRVFSENTRTVVLSFHGAGILSAHTLVPEEELILRSLESHREAEIRVVGEIGSQHGLHTYGVAFLDLTLDFWQLPFPPAPTVSQSSATMSLECVSCKSSILLEHADLEFDVHAVQGGVIRYCTKCGFSTMWKHPSHLSVTAPLVVPAAVKRQPVPAPTAIAVLEPPAHPTMSLEPLAANPFTDRRCRVRAKVNYTACIRSESFGDDVVDCIDMSRGGLSFRTGHAYLLAAVVQVAVPFSRETPEAPAIFVPARVAHVRQLSGTDLYRVGLAFIRR
jgi:PilZ domain